MKVGGAAVECCSITSFFFFLERMAKFQFPFCVFLNFFGLRTRCKVGHQWLV